MRNKIIGKYIIYSLAFASILFTPFLGKAEIPEYIIGYAWVADPDQLLSDMDKFMQEMDIPPMASMIIKMGLGELLENPNLAGVDMSSPICVVGVDPEQPDSWAINFTLSNPATYLRTINKTLQVKSEDNESGITTYRKEVEEFDSEAYESATEKEQENTSEFYRTVETTVSIAINNKSAWISLDPMLLKKIYTLKTGELKPQLDSKLVVVLQVQPLLDYAEPLIRQEISSLDLPEGDDSSPLGEQATRNMLKSYVDLYLHYARQVKTAALGLTINGEGVILEKFIAPKTETPLEEFLLAQKRGNLSLARYLAPTPWMVIDGRIQKQEMLLEAYKKIFDLFSGVINELDDKDIDKSTFDLAKLEKIFFKNIQDYIKCSGDEMAVSISSDPDSIFSAAMVQKITDPDMYRSYITSSYLDGINELMPLYNKLGINFDLTGVKTPETYKGAEIFTAKIKFDFNKLVEQDEMGPEEKRALALLEAPMSIQMAVKDKLAVTEISWGKQPDIKARLDLIVEGKSSFNPEELGNCREDVNGVILFSVNRYLKDMVSGIINKMAPEDIQGPETEILKRLGGLDLPLLACFVVKDGNLKVRTSISMNKILAVKSAIEDLQNPPDSSEPAKY